MTHRFTFGVLTAVSSDAQARDDKASLEDQEKMSRNEGIRQGGFESTKPFVLDGYSRTGYVNLSDALKDIPPLADALQAAANGKLDVLIMDNIERLGDLAPMIATHFKQYKKQIHSVRQSGPIHDPATYDPNTDDAMNILIHVEGIIQNYRVNKLRRGWSIGMPRRIADGLTPTRMPFAYTYTGSKTPPDLDPAKAAKLIQARDMLMNGESYTSIARHLGINRTRVPLVMGNPFYAGIVSFNKTYIQHTGTKRSQIKQPKSKWTVGTGKHTPIFTTVEHEDIVAELDRREQVKRRQDNGFVFAALLRCGVCGERARWHNFGSPGKYHKVVVCRVASARHIRHDYDHFFELVSSAIQREMARDHDGGDVDETEDKADIIRQAIAATKNKRARVQDGFERGIYDSAEASARLRSLEKDTERLHRDLEKSTVEKVSRRDAAAFMQDVDPALVPEWLERGDTRRINRLLTAWLKEIRVNVDGVQLVKR